MVNARTVVILWVLIAQAGAGQQCETALRHCEAERKAANTAASVAFANFRRSSMRDEKLLATNLQHLGQVSNEATKQADIRQLLAPQGPSGAASPHHIEDISRRIQRELGEAGLTKGVKELVRQLVEEQVAKANCGSSKAAPKQQPNGWMGTAYFLQKPVHQRGAVYVFSAVFEHGQRFLELACRKRVRENFFDSDCHMGSNNKGCLCKRKSLEAMWMGRGDQTLQLGEAEQFLDFIKKGFSKAKSVVKKVASKAKSTVTTIKKKVTKRIKRFGLKLVGKFLPRLIVKIGRLLGITKFSMDALDCLCEDYVFHLVSAKGQLQVDNDAWRDLSNYKTSQPLDFNFYWGTEECYKEKGKKKCECEYRAKIHYLQCNKRDCSNTDDPACSREAWEKRQAAEGKASLAADFMKTLMQCNPNNVTCGGNTLLGKNINVTIVEEGSPGRDLCMKPFAVADAVLRGLATAHQMLNMFPVIQHCLFSSKQGSN